MRKQYIKTLERRNRPPRQLGALYWEDIDNGGFFRLPTVAEWEALDAEFRQIEKPDHNDIEQLKRWKAYTKAAARGEQFKADRETLEKAGITFRHIPQERRGHPCIKGLYEGATGEFTAVLRLYGDNVEFWRASK